MSSMHDDTVTVEFPAVAVSNRKRFKKHGSTYTNLRCNSCNQWWMMLALGEKKKYVHCPWCGEKVKIERS